MDLDAGVLHRCALDQSSLVEAEAGPAVTLTRPGVEPFVVTIDELRR